MKMCRRPKLTKQTETRLNAEQQSDLDRQSTPSNQSEREEEARLLKDEEQATVGDRKARALN